MATGKQRDPCPIPGHEPDPCPHTRVGGEGSGHNFLSPFLSFPSFRAFSGQIASVVAPCFGVSVGSVRVFMVCLGYKVNFLYAKLGRRGVESTRSANGVPNGHAADAASIDLARSLC
jgi:hypothetical protein